MIICNGVGFYKMSRLMSLPGEPLLRGHLRFVHLELVGSSPWGEQALHGCQCWILVFLEDSPWDWLHPEQKIQTLLKPGKVPTKQQGLGEGPKPCDSSVS